MVFNSSRATSPFREKLGRELVVGTWVNAVKDTVVAKLIGQAGFDYMLLDAEHSGAGMGFLSEACMLARECGVYPMVRPVEPNDLKNNGRLLDAGAMGLVIPHIDTAEQAGAIANSMRFCDGGTRGYCSRTAGSGFEKVDLEAMLRSDREVTCVVQFESVAAIEQAEEILSVPGIDVAIVGRGDLAHDMGLSGRVTDDRVGAMVERVYAAARACGKVCGLLVNDPAEAAHWLPRGIGFLTMGSEVGLLCGAYGSALKQIRTYAEAK